MYAVVAVFLTTYAGACKPAVDAYVALCDVIDCFVCVTRGNVTPRHLARCVQSFLSLYCLAFGADHTTPKFHWLLHFPSYLEKFGTLVACYVHERKHKMLKRYCTDIRNTTVFEHSVLAEVAALVYARTHVSLAVTYKCRRTYAGRVCMFSEH